MPTGIVSSVSSSNTTVSSDQPVSVPLDCGLNFSDLVELSRPDHKRLRFTGLHARVRGTHVCPAGCSIQIAAIVSASPLDILSKRKLQPILFVDSSEIRL